MTRKIAIYGQRFDVSKSEKAMVDALHLSAQADAQKRFDKWYTEAPTPESKQRRAAIGNALKLKVQNA